MYLRKLFLKNHRNIVKCIIEPSNEFNVLWGDNAQGKTNVLEAIYLLGNLRSFRCHKYEELIGYDGTKSHISGDVVCCGIHRRLELIIGQGGKEVKINGKNIKSVGDFLGFLQPVLFSPEEVALIKGNPAGRRSLLDRAIFQTDSLYLEKAQHYERCLRQRNKLLKEGKNKLEIEPWTEQLIAAGARIRSERLHYLERLVPLLKEIYNAIAGGGETADLRYLSGFEDEEVLRLLLRCELKKQEEKERIFGQTLSGPHRDDPLFLVNGRPLRSFGSQGQQRSYMLAFKTAQIMDIEKQRGESPVLLLDDMTGELDRRRQDFFFRFLLERRGQVFITTTDIQSLKQEGLNNARFFRISKGNIED